MENIQYLSLDIMNNHVYEYAYAKQYDEGRILIFTVTENGYPYNLDDVSATFQMKKPDDTIILDSGIIEDNKIKINVTRQMTALQGKVPYQIQLLQGETIITTVTGFLKVGESVIDPDDVVSSDEFNALNDALIKVNKDYTYVMESAQTSADNAKVSEESAEDSAILSESWVIGGTGVREGEDVDNSKYYAEQASESVLLAQSAKIGAETAETNAQSSMDFAKNCANRAHNSATNAENSAILSKSYAIGGTDIREGEDTDNSKHYYEQAKAISEGLGGALIPKGTVDFENLPVLANAENGWMYNISNQFTTTMDFREGAGLIIPAGANVYKTADEYWDVLAGSPVTSVNGERGNVIVTPENIGALAEDGNAVSATMATQDENGDNIVDTYLTKTGDTTYNIATFYTPDVKDDEYVDTLIESGDSHNSLFNRIAVFFNNVRYLYKMLGTIDISAIGDGSVTGAIKALGYQDEYYGINGLIFTRSGKKVIVSSNGSRANVADIVATTIPQEFCPHFDTRIPILVSSGNHNNVNGDLQINPDGKMRVYCNTADTYGGGSYATVYTGNLLVNGSYIATDIE